MYPEASIKLRSSKTHVKVASKQLTRLAGNLTSVFTQISGAMNRGMLPDISFIGSLKRHSMKKEATTKMWRGSLKRYPMKKEVTQKNVKGLIKKTSDEKRVNSKKCEEAHQKDFWWKKRQLKKYEGGSLKRSMMK
jgi:hypothetical protein